VNRAYFTRYCNDGPYDQLWSQYSRVEHCLEIVRRLDVPARDVLVLGAATGRVLQRFEQEWNLRPWGCEVSRWAWDRIPPRLRRRIRRADMRSYVPELIRARRSFDLAFTNALVYLDARELPEFLDRTSRICGHLHFWSSTSGDFARGDRWRRTLRPLAWWSGLLRASGFAPTRSRYLWRSTRRGAFSCC
jgi:hypothetical protein